MGTPELACASLKALCRAPGIAVTGVVTQPDRPKGRDQKVQASPVKELALQFNLPVLQPERARAPDFFEQLQKLKPDLIAVAAYGQIVPTTILDLPPFGCLNVHTSLLPKYRGAAPIQWAILNGDCETGVTIMKMDAGMDTGGIVSQETTRIVAEDDAETLHDRLAQLGADLLLRTIPDYVSGKLQPRPQPAEGASYAPKIKKQHGQIDWSHSAEAIWNRVRGLKPWPGAFTLLPGGQKQLLKVWRAEVQPAATAGAPGEILEATRAGVSVCCGQGVLRLMELQREGGRRLAAEPFLAGHPLRAGEKLG